MSHNISYLRQNNFNTLNSSTKYNRRNAIRRRLELNMRHGTSVENNNNSHQNTNINSNSNNNTNTSSSLIYNNHTFRASFGNSNTSREMHNNTQTNIRNSQTISVNEVSSTTSKYRRRHLNNNIFISVYKNKKLKQKLFEIEEEQKKEESNKIEEENIGSEIKDTVNATYALIK